MSPAVISLLFDGALAVLLIVTIGYCNKLTKKIRQLQDGRSELAEMISRFDKSTERATSSLAELQNVSKKITEALQLKIDKANFLADDLAFLIEKSSKLAGQLEQLQKQRTEVQKEAARHAAAPYQPPRPFFETPAAPHKPAIIRAESAAPPPVDAHPANTPSVASIEAMLQKLAASAPGKRPAPAESDMEARTGAERELLNALKTGR